jgi:hypothetical protein
MVRRATIRLLWSVAAPPPARHGGVAGVPGTSRFGAIGLVLAVAA